MKSSGEREMATVGFVALGCPKNIVDSEKMLAEIGESGFVLSGDPDNADVVVINTCGFIAPAKEEALDAIRQAVARKKKGRVGKVVVCGCLSERMGEALFDEVEGIDAVVGLGQRAAIGRIIKDVIARGGKAGAHPRVYLGKSADEALDDRGRLLITPAHWAYLRISEGCDRTCSFCTIPSIRGRFRSKDPDVVIAEARELAANGAVELSLIAQDSNYYLRDRGVRNGLVKLIDDLAAIDGLEWIRLMYLYPATIDDELIAAVAGQPKVVHYVDMPLQHVNDAILKAMRRADRKDTTIALVEKLRAAVPDVVLRTTVITGFPGETDEAFEELMEFVQWAKFDALGCFPFYAEAGTPAATLDGQVPEHVRHARADRLMLAQQEIAFAAARRRIGQELTCLVDETDEQGAMGRFYGQAPHIDSVCYVQGPAAGPGEFVRVRITDTQDYDLIARRI
jgi:ribosomal protein S12 methylthiotransferase